MSCCATGFEPTFEDEAARRAEEVRLASRVVGDGIRQTDLSVPTMHCGGCIRAVETALNALPGVEAARVNLSSKRATIRWHDGAAPPPFVETLRGIGHDAHLFDPGAERKDAALGELLRALAVAGFAASNIMLLSVSVWAGADPATRNLFHGISALIALPALAYSGRLFFRSAWSALRCGRTNMDVPISIGVLMAFGLSLYETLHQGAEAYFDASVTLLFFLLIGRTLDHLMRERARTAVKGLERLAARGALVAQPDGDAVYLPIEEIRVGMTILLAAGERVPVDGRVVSGRSDIDRSLLTGESAPAPVASGALLHAGALNLTGPLALVATAVARDSFLAEMMRLMETAEAGRSTYRRIADRASRLYAPVVHAAALLTLIGWLIATGDLHHALTVAIAVLIITCPCALGLAAPMVQVMAAGRLFELGVLVKDGGALERLAEIDTVVFDKTGTLTLGRPRLLDADKIDPAALRVAVTLAEQSRHPYSRALASAAQPGMGRLQSADVVEHAGAGMEARVGDRLYRLGRGNWALEASDEDAGTADAGMADAGMADVVLASDGRALARFRFEDRLRAGAREAIDRLRRDGLAVEVLSGDRDTTVRAIAEELGAPFVAEVSPAEKVKRIAAIGAVGHKVLMVGDGLNDAPALAAAHVSMAPASAADVSRSAADLVFLHESLQAAPRAFEIARRAKRLVAQNLWLAVGYNVLAVPIAVMGHVTPLVAAIAMSTSSIVVTVNALRLRAGAREQFDEGEVGRGSTTGRRRI